MTIGRLAIIGVGLIGGSLARALKSAGGVKEVIGTGRSAEQLDLALKLGVIDRVETVLKRAVQGAEMVVLATPVGSMPMLLEAIAGPLSGDCVVTDVGSVKESLVEVARTALGDRFPQFVPGHPIAGAEQSGIKASRADLFQDRPVVLTPVAETDRVAVDRVATLWRATGARVTELDPRRHDEVVALTSHLPHLLAFSAVSLLGDRDQEAGANGRLFDFVGTGFCDFSRIAASDPAMWRDICLHNRPAVLEALSAFVGRLESLSQTVAAGDHQQLFDLFTRAQALRTQAANCSGRPASSRGWRRSAPSDTSI